MNRISRRWPEKPTRQLADVAAWSPAVAQLAAAALAAGQPDARAAAEHLAALVLAPLGGPMPLTWAMDWEPLAVKNEEL